jgi:uncharacterized glyoxalase superfamily protein PhnB
MAETVEPYVLYEDAASAMEFLSSAFGFREVAAFPFTGGTCLAR